MGLYKINKQKKVGATIECPVCHKKFLKKQYSQAFCCLHCKDAFHNKHNGDRHRDPNYYDKYNNYRNAVNGYDYNPDDVEDMGHFTDLDIGTHD